jgi:hypothetical protein
MTADELKAQFREFCLQTLKIRRYTGLGAARTHTDYAASGNLQVYGAAQLVGGVTQGDQRAIMIAGDLTTAGLTLPVTTDDKAVTDDGREVSIKAVLPRRALDGTLIAYELQVRG